MILSDGTVRLRPWRASDAAAVQAVADDEIVRRYSSIRDGAEKWLAAQSQPGRVSLAITELPGDEALGKVGLRLADGELGYWVVPAARGRGLATRAMRILAQHAFDALGFDELRLEIEPDNEPSLRVAIALGAEPTGERATESDRDGVLREFVVFRLVA